LSGVLSNKIDGEIYFKREAEKLAIQVKSRFIYLILFIYFCFYLTNNNNNNSVIVTGGVDVIRRKEEISNLLKTTKIAGF
jgi:hypothetical protein